MELERSFPSALLPGHLKTQIDPRALSELGCGPPVSVGQAGMPHWTATINEKMARAREKSFNSIVGRGDFGGQ